MSRETLPDSEVRRLLNGGVVALVTTAWHGQENVAPVIWHTPLSIMPPLIGIVVHPSRLTHDMIKYSENFALNIPTPQLMRHVQYAGVVSGANVNKMEALRLPTIKAKAVQAPLLDFCVGWIECGLQDAHRIGDHTLFVGKVVHVSVESAAFDGVWKTDDPDLRPLHYLGGPFYASLREQEEAVLEREESESGAKEGDYRPPPEREEGERG
ncbi:MAG: flavin reductase family protein [Dehalococcoidia bacterium]|nr:flavin reductase family protein [Dehalococcoidia bacterium]